MIINIENDCFVTQLTDLIIDISPLENIKITTTIGSVVYTVFDEKIYNETEEGYVLPNMCGLLYPYTLLSAQKGSPVCFFEIDVYGGDEQEHTIQTLRIVHSRLYIEEDPIQWSESKFLTSAPTKKVFMGDQEEVYVLNMKDIDDRDQQYARVSVKYLSTRGEILYKKLTNEFIGQDVVAENTIGEIMVWPEIVKRLIGDTCKKLLSYTLSFRFDGDNNARLITYHVSSDVPRTTFKFRNTFGCMEYISLIGETESEQDVEQKTVLINNKNVNYDTLVNHYHHLKSGLIRGDDYIRISDFLSSDEIYLVIDGDELPIILSEIENKKSDSVYKSYNVSFTWQLQDKNKQISL